MSQADRTAMMMSIAEIGAAAAALAPLLDASGNRRSAQRKTLPLVHSNLNHRSTADLVNL